MEGLWPWEGLHCVVWEMAYQPLSGCWVENRLGIPAGTSWQGSGERQLPLGPVEAGGSGVIAGHCRQHSQQHLRQILRFPGFFPYLHVVHSGPRRGLGRGWLRSALSHCLLWLAGGAGNRGTCGLTMVAQLEGRLRVALLDSGQPPWPEHLRTPAERASLCFGPNQGRVPPDVANTLHDPQLLLVPATLLLDPQPRTAKPPFRSFQGLQGTEQPQASLSGDVLG